MWMSCFRKTIRLDCLFLMIQGFIMSSSPITRRTNRERSEETKGRLLDATVQCLMSAGYVGTTTTMICEKAGVSRGAMLHHYPRKAALVSAAIEHVFDRRVEEFRVSMARLPEGQNRLTSAIDLLWDAYGEGETFYPSLEFMVAARTDPMIRAEIESLSQRIVEEVESVFFELFEVDEEANPLAALAPRFALVVMDGLALSRLVGTSESDARVFLEGLKGIAALVEPNLVEKGGT